MAQPKNTILFFTMSVLLTFILVRSDSPSEVISLKNKTHYTCVTKSESPVFLDPPLFDNNTRNSSKIELILKSDEWKLVSSTKSNHGPITDKRWEDFKIEFRNHMEVSLYPESVFSLSVYDMPDTTIEFYVMDEEYMNFVDFYGNNTHWNHYSVQLKNGNMTFSQNDLPITQTTNFIPSTLIVISSNNTFFKIHDYDFYESRSISTKPEKISINECMFLYTYLCSDCYLNVSSVSNITHYHIRGQDKWTKAIIENENKNDTYTIYKGRHDNKINGYWAMQSTKCVKRKNQTVIQEFPIDRNESQICLILRDKKENASISKNELLKCNPGVFGNECDIECTTIFGANKSHCEGYKIYINDNNYTCLWGRKGEFCDKECEQSHWGPNCIETCDRKDCDCNIFTGMCKNTTQKISNSETLERESVSSTFTPELSTLESSDNNKEAAGVLVVIILSFLTVGILILAIICYKAVSVLINKTLNHVLNGLNNFDQNTSQKNSEENPLNVA